MSNSCVAWVPGCAEPLRRGITHATMKRVVLLAGAGLLAMPAARASDEWPQWRGPERTGSLAAQAGAASWPESLVEQWEREVGAGYSGPVVSGDRVWVQARLGRREIVRCLRLEDGTEVWTAGYPAEFEQHSSARDHGRGPYSTPTVTEGRLFTLSVTALLSVWKADTGDLLWRRDFSPEFDPSFPIFGAAASPLVWQGLCFIHLGCSDEQRPGEPGRGAMVALRVTDGSEVWRWSADGPSLGASPILHVIDGRPQLVFKSRRNIVGLEPLTGAELWRIPFEVSQGNTIVTPLCVEDRLFTSDHHKGFHAWSIRGEGGTWSARHLWRGRDSLFTSSPVVAGGLVVGLSSSRRGHLFALDPGDGAVLWRGEPGWGEHVSLISRGDEVLVFREGVLTVGAVSREGFRSLRTYRLDRLETWSHPAVVRDRILVKEGTRVVAYGLGAR